jgi:glycine/D-amino acid oxidase-like deaminating enzyme
MSDVLVVGGGVIGLSVAWELAGQGARVTLLEQGGLGSEASWAGAGILPPGNLERASTPEDRLRSLSDRLWPQWSAELHALTGIDNGYRNCGGIEVSFARSTEQLDAEAAAWRAEGVSVERLCAAGLREREPAIADEAVAGYRLPELSQVRNPRHLKALDDTCSDVPADHVLYRCGRLCLSVMLPERARILLSLVFICSMVIWSHAAGEYLAGKLLTASYRSRQIISVSATVALLLLILCPLISFFSILGGT